MRPAHCARENRHELAFRCSPQVVQSYSASPVHFLSALDTTATKHPVCVIQEYNVYDGTEFLCLSTEKPPVH